MLTGKKLRHSAHNRTIETSNSEDCSFHSQRVYHVGIEKYSFLVAKSGWKGLLYYTCEILLSL